MPTNTKKHNQKFIIRVFSTQLVKCASNCRHFNYLGPFRNSSTLMANNLWRLVLAAAPCRLRHDDRRHHHLRQRLCVHRQLPAHEPAHRLRPAQPSDHMTRGGGLQNACSQSGERSRQQQREVRLTAPSGGVGERKKINGLEPVNRSAKVRTKLDVHPGGEAPT